MTRVLAGAMMALMISSSTGNAATANVPFTGTVTATCVLTVGIPGVLAPNAGFTEMSSTNGGGVAGTVAALSTGGTFKVSAIAPTAFTAAPSGGGTAVTFASTYSGTGATTIGSTEGATETTLTPGLTNLSINLAATKTSGTFPAGAYVTEVVVRCE